MAEVAKAELYWRPEVSDWRPNKKSRNSSLRIAAIVSDRLFQGLRYEGELLLVTPSRIGAMFTYAKPDLLLVESVARSSDGLWNTSASGGAGQLEELSSLIKMARSMTIPTVFWLTVGHEGLEDFRKTAELFDLIGCADQASADQLVKAGLNAVYLPPCVQPAIFNPFRHLDDENAHDLNILFDKGADLIESDAVRSVVEFLNGHGLTVLETRPSKDIGLMSVGDMTQGTFTIPFVTPVARLTALKNAKAYVTFGTSTSSWIEQQWMALEAAACRLAVVHLGRLEANDLLLDIVIDCSCEEEFLLELYRYSKDSLYRERIAHLVWRHVNERHTFSHRMAQLCRELELIHDWVEYPKVSVITPTYRRDLLKSCIDNYQAFSYPNKELVIVFNGNELPDLSELGVTERNDITVTNVPSDLFAGAALNTGHLAATGQYIFRVDDDDYYGHSYLTDMVFSARTINADLFGKSPAPLSFEGSDKIYVKEDSKEFLILDLNSIHNSKVWLGGNTVAGLANFFESNPYIDYAYGAADSSMQLNIEHSDKLTIALMDKFNVVAFRNKDITLHTWKGEADKLKNKRQIFAGKGEYLV